MFFVSKLHIYWQMKVFSQFLNTIKLKFQKITLWAPEHETIWCWILSTEKVKQNAKYLNNRTFWTKKNNIDLWKAFRDLHYTYIRWLQGWHTRISTPRWHESPGALCHPMSTAEGDITRQGFRVTEGLIFWYSRPRRHMIYVMWHYRK